MGFLRRWVILTRPSSAITDPEERRRARMLCTVTFGLALILTRGHRNQPVHELEIPQSLEFARVWQDRRSLQARPSSSGWRFGSRSILAMSSARG